MKPTVLTLEGSNPVDFDVFARVAAGRMPLELHPDLGSYIQPATDLALQRMDRKQLIYGLTTGFGPLGNRFLPLDSRLRVQQNLVYHLASGVGPPMEAEEARAVLLARLINLSRGYSAVSINTLQIMAQWLNLGLIPHIPSLGTVGASGDLTPLAHLALDLMGEGRIWWEGCWKPSGPLLADLNIPVLEPGLREGLALVNGTSAMTAYAALNAVDARQALMLALDLSLFHAEALKGDRDAWHPGLARVKPHPGQLFVAQYLYELASGSTRLGRVSSQPRFEAEQRGPIKIETQPLQEPYTSRCLPQIYGAILDVLDFHDRLVHTELNGVSDNPLFLAEEDLVLHGGNFYGQHISFAADALANALVKMGAHLERKINRICHPALNRQFPAFLQERELGINSGFMGAQVSATALVAEMRGMNSPLSNATIATNADNQDVVSMGTLAALRCRRLLPHLFRLLAIDAMTCAQAYDLCSTEEQQGFSPKSQNLYRQIRSQVAKLENDRPLSQDIENLALFLRSC